jgi:hypothetical protein
MTTFQDDLDPGAEGFQIGTFREEMREMPALQRWVIYVALSCGVLLLLQCLFIFPIILIKYGWGYNAG